jgi:hypothetical protein
MRQVYGRQCLSKKSGIIGLSQIQLTGPHYLGEGLRPPLTFHAHFRSFPVSSRWAVEDEVVAVAVACEPDLRSGQTVKPARHD